MFKVTQGLSVELDNKLYFSSFILFYYVVVAQLRRTSGQVWWGGPLTGVGRLLVAHVICVELIEIRAGNF